MVRRVEKLWNVNWSYDIFANANFDDDNFECDYVTPLRQGFFHSTKMRNAILDSLNNYDVTLIHSATSTGKSYVIPLLLWQYYCKHVQGTEEDQGFKAAHGVPTTEQCGNIGRGMKKPNSYGHSNLKTGYIHGSNLPFATTAAIQEELEETTAPTDEEKAQGGSLHYKDHYALMTNFMLEQVILGSCSATTKAAIHGRSTIPFLIFDEAHTMDFNLSNALTLASTKMGGYRAAGMKPQFQKMVLMTATIGKNHISTYGEFFKDKGLTFNVVACDNVLAQFSVNAYSWDDMLRGPAANLATDESNLLRSIQHDLSRRNFPSIMDSTGRPVETAITICGRYKDDYAVDTTEELKVIATTNNLESGVTVPRTADVIDCGVRKIAGPFRADGVQELIVMWADEYATEQRKGRGGRDMNSTYLSVVEEDISQLEKMGRKGRYQNLSSTFDESSYVVCFEDLDKLPFRPNTEDVLEIGRSLMRSGLAAMDPQDHNIVKPSRLVSELSLVFRSLLPREALLVVHACDAGVLAPMLWAVAVHKCAFSCFVKPQRVKDATDENARFGTAHETALTTGRMPRIHIGDTYTLSFSEYLSAGIYALQANGMTIKHKNLVWGSERNALNPAVNPAEWINFFARTIVRDGLIEVHRFVDMLVRDLRSVGILAMGQRYDETKWSFNRHVERHPMHRVHQVKPSGLFLAHAILTTVFGDKSFFIDVKEFEAKRELGARIVYSSYRDALIHENINVVGESAHNGDANVCGFNHSFNIVVAPNLRKIATNKYKGSLTYIPERMWTLFANAAVGSEADEGGDVCVRHLVNNTLPHVRSLRFNSEDEAAIFDRIRRAIADVPLCVMDKHGPNGFWHQFNENHMIYLSTFTGSLLI